MVLYIDLLSFVCLGVFLGENSLSSYQNLKHLASDLN